MRLRKTLEIIPYLQTPDTANGTDNEDRSTEVPCPSGGAVSKSATRDWSRINDNPADEVA